MQLMQWGTGAMDVDMQCTGGMHMMCHARIMHTLCTAVLSALVVLTMHACTLPCSHFRYSKNILSMPRYVLIVAALMLLTDGLLVCWQLHKVQAHAPKALKATCRQAQTIWPSQPGFMLYCPLTGPVHVCAVRGLFATWLGR